MLSVHMLIAVNFLFNAWTLSAAKIFFFIYIEYCLLGKKSINAINDDCYFTLNNRTLSAVLLLFVFRSDFFCFLASRPWFSKFSVCFLSASLENTSHEVLKQAFVIYLPLLLSVLAVLLLSFGLGDTKVCN